MRKTLFIFAMVIAWSSCLAQLPKDTIQYQRCKVKRIKKIENAYIVYVKAPEIFPYGCIAVISPYCVDNDGTPLRILKRYDLYLASYFDQYIVWMHDSFYDINFNNLNIRLKEDGSIHGMLFYSPNLCGKYYKPLK